MPKENAVQKEIKEAKFIEALVDNAGQINEAYKAIRPQVNDNSARSLGSKELAKISNDDTKALLVKVGCTKEAVLQGIWERMEKTKQLGQYVRGADVICKIGGFYTPPTNKLQELMDNNLDLVEIIKIRLKRKDSNNLEQKDVIDIKSNNVKNEDAS